MSVRRVCSGAKANSEVDMTFDPATRSQELKSILEALPPSVFADLVEAAASVSQSLRAGGGIYFVGNGGSAAEAEHLAAEFVGRFSSERVPLRAGALTASGALMTGLINDYPADELFARQVRGLLNRGDVLVAMSTSGRSLNVLRALDEAGRRGCLRIGITGSWCGDFTPRCEWVLSVPSVSVPRIQEVHLLLGHILCEIVEETLRSATSKEVLP
jgi:D-sedoheptulose 7-phosphate isomerase